MTNWKTYTIIGIPQPMRNGYDGSFLLDDYVNYWHIGSSKNENYIWCVNTYPYNTFKIGDKIEIDNDETKKYHCGDCFNDFSIVRKASSSSVATRNAMINASSVNANALATTCEMLDRVDRGEKTHFKYEIEDKGVKHSWIYKRN